MLENNGIYNKLKPFPRLNSSKNFARAIEQLIIIMTLSFMEKNLFQLIETYFKVELFISIVVYELQTTDNQ